jgi:signal transduction histidine kinase/PAS domain-containing protein
MKPGAPTSELEVVAMNEQAQNLLPWLGPEVPPLLLQRVIASQSLLGSARQAFETYTAQSGSTALGELPDSTANLAYTVQRMGDQLLIGLRKPANALEVALGGHLKENMLFSVVVFEAVRDGSGEIENLKLVYKNKAAGTYLALGEAIEPGQLLTDWYPAAKTTGLFPDFVKVIQTGEPLILERRYAEFREGYEMMVTRNGDGIIISYRNTTDVREARRQASELQKLMDTSQDMMALLAPQRDPQGRIVDLIIERINKVTQQSQLKAADNIIGASFSRITSDYEEVLGGYIDVIETGKPLRLERQVTRNGHSAYLDVSATQWQGKLLLIARNITAYKQAIQDLKTQQELLDGIINTSENLMVVAKGIWDEHGRVVDMVIVEANRNARVAMLETIGIDLMSRPLLEALGRKPELFMIAARVLEKNEPVILDKRYEAKSGKWYRISFRKVQQFLVITYTDITRINTARLEAENQNALLTAILNSSLDGVIGLEAIRSQQGSIEDFRIVMVNREAERIANAPEKELVGQTYITMFPVVQEDNFFESLKHAAQQKTSWHKEKSFPSKVTGGLRWIEFSMTPASADLFVLSFKDITEQVGWKQAQETLLQELKRSNKSLEQFAYIASHDLQEPARKIKSFGEILLRKFSDLLPPSGQDMMQRMISASERMQSMINALLTYSRLSNKTAAFEPVSLTEVVDEVLRDLDLTISEKNAWVQIDKLPVVKGNASQLHQLFLNLVSNSLKFTREHQPPVIAIRVNKATEADCRDTSVDPRKKYHAVCIEDNGIGFDSSLRHRVFELFYRLHGRSEYQGHGLGLAICKIVAEQHQGDIKVDSLPGQGTTFTVLLPVWEE